MRRILLYGKKNAGKTALAAEMLAQCRNAELAAVADPIKEFVCAVFDWPEAYLWGPSENRELPSYQWQINGETEWGKAETRLEQHLETWVQQAKGASSESVEVVKSLFWDAFDQLRDELMEDLHDPFSNYSWEEWKEGAQLNGRTLCKAFGEVGRSISPYFWVSQIPAGNEKHEFQFITDIRFPNEIGYLDSNSRVKPIVVKIVDPDGVGGDDDPTETAMDSFPGWDIWLVNPKDGNLKSRAAGLLASIRAFK